MVYPAAKDHGCFWVFNFELLFRQTGKKRLHPNGASNDKLYSWWSSLLEGTVTAGGYVLCIHQLAGRSTWQNCELLLKVRLNDIWSSVQILKSDKLNFATDLIKSCLCRVARFFHVTNCPMQWTLQFSALNEEVRKFTKSSVSNAPGCVTSKIVTPIELGEKNLDK